jgi:hypothetical protein
VIPALLAVPIVQGVVGSVVGQVANCFAPSSSASSSAPAPAPTTSFSPYLSRAASAAQPAQPAMATSPTGIMRADQWNQMGASDMKSWMTSLTGKHVNATDQTGRTISGVVSGVQQLGNTLAMSIGGHLVSLSQLKQVSWSPSTV